MKGRGRLSSRTNSFRPALELLEDRAVPTASFDFALRVGSTLDDVAWSTTIDMQGNSLVTGNFKGTVDFDPGPGIANLTSASAGIRDIFLAKYSAEGDFLWARRMGGIEDDDAFSVVADSAGNSYVAGYFGDDASFSSGISAFNLLTWGGTDGFVAKFDPSGNLQWARQFGGAADDTVNGVALDAFGNVLITGSFSDVADLDSNPTSQEFTSLGGFDLFAAKLDSQGNFLWVRTAGGTGNDIPEDIKVDVFGNLYVAGQFDNSANFNFAGTAFNLTSAGLSDAFLWKIDTAGNFINAMSFGGVGNDQAYALALDPAGTIHMAGSFADTVDFDPGTGVSLLTSNGGLDAFLVTLDPKGAFLRSTRIGGIDTDEALALATDASGNVYLGGTFQGIIVAGGTPLVSQGNFDSFMVRFDSSGAATLAGQLSGANNVEIYSLATDRIGNVLLAGSFEGTADFDPGEVNFPMSSMGQGDVFLTAWKETSLVTTSLPSVPEDSTNPSGFTVSTMLEGLFSDSNSATNNGIAITGLPGAVFGTWQYRLAGTTIWKNVGAVSSYKALLLRGTDRIRFVPLANFDGNVSLQFRLWDRSFGAAGSLQNLALPGSVGGSTAFSLREGLATLEVTALNDRPILDTVGAPNLTKVIANTAPLGDLVSKWLGSTVTDPDSGASFGLALTAANNTNGSWEYRLFESGIWTPVGSVSTSSALLLRSVDRIRFVPNPDYVGIATASFRAWDQTVGASGDRVAIGPASTAFSLDSQTASVEVVDGSTGFGNQAPILNALAVSNFTSILEDSINPAGDLIGAVLNGAISDPDQDALKGVAITGLNGTASGNWQYRLAGTTVWKTITQVSIANALQLRDTDNIRFLPSANFNGEVSLSYRAWDQTRGSAGKRANLSFTGATGGQTSFSASEATSRLLITPVNDRPVLNTAATPRFTSFSPPTIFPGDYVSQLVRNWATDVDGNSQVGIAITSAPSIGGTWYFLRDGAADYEIVGPVSATNALLLRPQDWLVFSPLASFRGTVSLSYRAWDQTSGVYGTKVNPIGTAFSTASDSAFLTINTTNDRPVLNTTLVPRVAGELPGSSTNQPITIGSLLANQVFDLDPNAKIGIALIGTTAPAGAWQFSTNGGITWSNVGAVSKIAALHLRSQDLLRFVPSGSFPTKATLTYLAWDQTRGTAGAKANTTLPGNTSVSLAAVVASLTINNAPEFLI